MQSLDPAIVSAVVFLFIWLVSWLKGPKWLTDVGKDLKAQVNELKTWAPRLMGAVKHNTLPQTVEEAKASGNPLVEGLATLGELAPAIQGILELLQNPQIQNLLGGAMNGSLGKPKESVGQEW